jgi:hypothetical protein
MRIASPLSIEPMPEQIISDAGAREIRHFRTIGLRAKGHSVGEAYKLTSHLNRTD